MDKWRWYVLAIFGLVASGAAVGVFLETHSLSASLTSLVLALTMLRLYSLIRSDLWIGRKGQEFSAAAVELRLVSNSPAKDVLSAYQRSEGDFFPFGIRAIVLEEWHKSERGGHSIAWVIYKFWKFYFFAPILAAGLWVGAAVVTPQTEQYTTNFVFYAGLLTAMGAFAIAAEACLCYFIFGSWSLSYHRLDVSPERSINELGALFGGLLSAFAVLAASITFLARSSYSYDHVQARSGYWVCFGLGIYYALTTLTSNGDAGPDTFQAFALTGWTYILSVSFLVIVVSLLIDSLGKDPKFSLLRKSPDADEQPLPVAKARRTARRRNRREQRSP